MPNELFFHQAVLAVAGIAGILEFFGAFFEYHPGSRRKKAFIAVCAGLFYVYFALGAFESLSNASSLELFGFFGCVLGCLGAVRLLCPDSPSSQRARSAADA